MHSTISKVIIAAFALGTGLAAPTPKDNTELIGDLITAPTQTNRFRKLLTDESGKLLEGDTLTNATIWDFNQNGFPIPGSNGGSASAANLENFPILIDSGLAFTVGSFGPCGLALPHVHPRASEFFVLSEGQIEFGTMFETGIAQDQHEVSGTLKKNMGTLFPMGAVHYQINNGPDCKPAMAFVAFSSEDAGTTPFLIDPIPETVAVGMSKRVDGTDFESVRAVTPLHIAKKVDECLARCNISS